MKTVLRPALLALTLAACSSTGPETAGTSVEDRGAGVATVTAGSASEGLLRDWPQINAGVQKHYGYAFQWFGLSVLVVLLYVWFQLVRRFYPRRRAAQPEG